MHWDDCPHDLKHTGIAHDAAQDTDTYTEIQNACALKQNTGCVHREKETRDCTKITQNTVLQLQGNRDCTMVIKARCCIHLHSTCSDETHMWRIHTEQTIHKTHVHACMHIYNTHEAGLQTHEHTQLYAHALRTEREGKQGPYYDHTNVLSA